MGSRKKLLYYNRTLLRNDQLQVVFINVVFIAFTVDTIGDNSAYYTLPIQSNEDLLFYNCSEIKLNVIQETL